MTVIYMKYRMHVSRRQKKRSLIFHIKSLQVWNSVKSKIWHTLKTLGSLVIFLSEKSNWDHYSICNSQKQRCLKLPVFKTLNYTWLHFSFYPNISKTYPCENVPWNWEYYEKMMWLILYHLENLWLIYKVLIVNRFLFWRCKINLHMWN